MKAYTYTEIYDAANALAYLLNTSDDPDMEVRQLVEIMRLRIDHGSMVTIWMSARDRLNVLATGKKQELTSHRWTEEPLPYNWVGDYVAEFAAAWDFWYQVTCKTTPGILEKFKHELERVFDLRRLESKIDTCLNSETVAHIANGQDVEAAKSMVWYLIVAGTPIREWEARRLVTRFHLVTAIRIAPKESDNV